MQKILISLLALLLTGCADIRGRVTPDMLAVRTGAAPELAVHISEDDGIIRAQCDPINFHDALCAAAGAEISAGHISVLLLQGNPGEILPAYLENGWLMPTAETVWFDTDAVSFLTRQPIAAEDIKAAVQTGLIPPRTADTVLADLMGGSGVTAVTAHTNGGFRLALWDAKQFCGTLSEDACRGLALLAGRYRSFTLSDETACFTVEHAAPVIRAVLSGGVLQISVSGNFRCSLRSGSLSGIEPMLTQILTAALHETVTHAGADLLHLQERAKAGAVHPAAWRETLRSAEITVMIQTEIAERSI